MQKIFSVLKVIEMYSLWPILEAIICKFFKLVSLYDLFFKCSL